MTGQVLSSGSSNDYVHGFSSLASFIASDEDHSTSIYKRFDDLASRNLLYYQSELAELAALQQKYDLEDCKDLTNETEALNVRERNQNWNAFKAAGARGQLPDTAKLQASGSTTNSTNHETRHSSRSSSPSLMRTGSSNTAGNRYCADRYELAMQIRSTLREYREALIQESTLLALQSPTKQTLDAFANYYHGRSSTSHQGATPDNNIPRPMLTGASAVLYPVGMTSSQIPFTDLVSLAPHRESDSLTSFFKTYLSWVFRSRPSPLLPQYNGLPPISHLTRHQLRHYSSRRLSLTTSLITTILAALLLFLPIYTLYHVSRDQPGQTLGLIALFTLLFALAIVVTTNARRAEVFGACAAYAAVLVVFVSGDFAGGAGGGG